MDNETAKFAATVYRLIGFILVPALYYLTAVGKAPPGLALAVSAIWIVSYFYRFTRKPENVVHPTTAVAWLGLFIAALTVYILNEATQDRTFISNLRAICEDIAEPDSPELDFCDRLDGAIDRYLSGDDAET